MEAMNQFLTLCGWITVIGGAGAFVFKIIAPAFRIESRVTKIEKKQIKDFERLESIEMMQKQQNKAMAALLNHMIDGNGIEKMKVIRDELLTEIIEH